jgi:AcrR family transcriptional regulator
MELHTADEDSLKAGRASDRGRATPAQARSQARYEEVLAAAERLYSERGFDAVGINDVADAVGTARGALYRWFPDRQALGAAVAERVSTRLLNEIAVVVVDADVRTNSLIPILITNFARIAVADRAAIALLAQPANTGGPGRMILARLTEAVAAIVGVRVPDAPPDEVEVTALAIASASQALLVQASERVGDDRERVLAELVYMLTAYVLTKYPFAHSPAWSDDSQPRPVRAAAR